MKDIEKMIDDLLDIEEGYAFKQCGNCDDLTLEDAHKEVLKARKTLLDSIAPKTSRAVNHAMQRFDANMSGQAIGWNDALEWAAAWIEGSLAGEDNERVIEFTKNQAISIRSAKKPR